MKSIEELALKVAKEMWNSNGVYSGHPLSEMQDFATRFLAAYQLAQVVQQRDELLAALEKERVSHAATGHAMGGKCQELFLENGELQKDAERYRWILQQAKITDFIFAYTKSNERHVSNAIDAAIAKVQP